MSVICLSMRIAICGAWPARGEGVHHVAGPLRLRVDEVEGVAVEAGLVGDVVHRRGDVVDRDDVRLADLDADQREPLRQRSRDLLDRLEEVVRAVDLVHLAGLGVADDDRRAGRRATAPSRACGRCARTRTSCGGRGA